MDVKRNSEELNKKYIKEAEGLFNQMKYLTKKEREIYDKHLDYISEYIGCNLFEF